MNLWVRLPPALLMTKDLDEIIKNHCLSDFEGCLCFQLKNHKNLHECGCGITWDDEQAAKWWLEFQEEMKKYERDES
jgi:hypothetical protein